MNANWKAITMDDLVSEAAAYAAYRGVVRDKELREARQRGALGYVRRARRVFYLRRELESYVNGRLVAAYHPGKEG